MPPRTPAALADEIRAERGPWSLDGARLRPPRPRNPRSFPVGIMVSGEPAWSEIDLDRGPRAPRKDTATELERAGYQILSIEDRPFHARRRLWNLREIAAEVRRLDALSKDYESVHAFPDRRPRKPGLPASSRPFSVEAFDALRREHGWRPEWVSVARRGLPTFARSPKWTGGAWCWVHDDGKERLFELHVQIFRKGRDDAFEGEFRRLERELKSRLVPLGYTTIDVGDWRKGGVVMLNKKLASLSHARRQRAVLDDVLFGD